MPDDRLTMDQLSTSEIAFLDRTQDRRVLEYTVDNDAMIARLIDQGYLHIVDDPDPNYLRLVASSKGRAVVEQL